jgi:hypothetical protein
VKANADIIVMTARQFDPVMAAHRPKSKTAFKWVQATELPNSAELKELPYS